MQKLNDNIPIYIRLEFGRPKVFCIEMKILHNGFFKYINGEHYNEKNLKRIITFLYLYGNTLLF